jgi:fatty acid desaturase
VGRTESIGVTVKVTTARTTAVDGRSRGVVPERREFLRPIHGVANVVQVLAEHALLLLWFWLAPRYLPLVAYVPASLVACLVHQRAMSEWVHEGAHYNLLPNRTWNDRLTDALAGVWFFMPVRVYRATHFAHHAKPDFFVADDPDTAFLDVESRRAFRWAVMRDLSGFTILTQFRRFGEKAPEFTWRWKAVALVLHAALLVLAIMIGRIDIPILYYATLGTLYPLLNRLRVYGQHVMIDESGVSRFRTSATSRTIEGGPLDRIIHTSPRLMYHHEHHAFPHLPYRALRRLVDPTADVNRYARRRWVILRAVYRGLPG